MAARELNCGMKWGESLNEHFTFDIATTGASSHLGQELKGPFAGAEIRLVQSKVCINYPDQRDVWKMQAFGDHLRAHQDVDFSDAKIAEDPSEIIFTLECIGVHTFDARMRKEFGQRLLDSLGAQT